MAELLKLKLLRLKILSQREEDAGGPGEREKAGHGNHPLQEAPPVGQTVGGIKEILPVAEIMRRLVAETEAAPSRAAALS